MTSYEMELVIDFGEVGYRRAGHPFKIRLKADGLWALFKDAIAAHRVYELLLIERPGDVWDYVSVVVEDAPAVLQRIESDPLAAAAGHPATPPEQVHELPFSAFDQLFCWAGDDTMPEDSAWLTHRDSAVMRAFAQQLLAAAGAARGRLGWADPLIRHTVDRIRSNEHPFVYLSRPVAIERGREHSPNPASHTEAFYKQLEELLRDPALASVAYRADGDHGVLRAMAVEQRRRASRTGHKPGHAMHLSALTNRTISNEDWGSEIWFFEEGLAHGDLFIEGGGLEGAPIKWLVQRHGRVPGHILPACDDSLRRVHLHQPRKGQRYEREQPAELRRQHRTLAQGPHGADDAAGATPARGACIRPNGPRASSRQHAREQVGAPPHHVPVARPSASRRERTTGSSMPRASRLSAIPLT